MYIFVWMFKKIFFVCFYSSCLCHKPPCWESGSNGQSSSELDAWSWRTYWIFSHCGWLWTAVGSREHTGHLSRAGGWKALFCYASELEWRSDQHYDCNRAYRSVLLQIIQPWRCVLHYNWSNAIVTGQFHLDLKYFYIWNSMQYATVCLCWNSFPYRSAQLLFSDSFYVNKFGSFLI